MSTPSHIRFDDPENASGDASEDFPGVAASAGVMDYDGNESKNDFTSVVQIGRLVTDTQPLQPREA
jgi:hypothetical protein